MAKSAGFPTSRLTVACLVLNFWELWKKHTTLPSFAYSGWPYQVLGESIGAVGLDDRMDPLRMGRSCSGRGFRPLDLSEPGLSPAGAQRSCWMRTRLPAGSRKAQSRAP